MMRRRMAETNCSPPQWFSNSRKLFRSCSPPLELKFKSSKLMLLALSFVGNTRVFRRFCYRSAPLGQVYTQTLRAAEPFLRRGFDRGASCRFGLLRKHHQLVTWLNVRTLFAARSKRCSSTTCIIELFSAERLIRSLGRCSHNIRAHSK